MPVDLSADLHRIRRHIPHLEQAAAKAGSVGELIAAVLELADWRLAAEAAEHDRAIPNDLEHDRKEADRG